MSRTREIEVYIYKERMDDPWFNCHQADSKNINKKEMIKGRLIVDLPERKVTISESEFDRLVGANNTANTGWIKNKLFKDAE